MGLDFLKHYAAGRLEQYDLQPFPLDEASNQEAKPNLEQVVVNYETSNWQPIDLNLSPNWRLKEWQERPIRFIDGKDVGQTIAWVHSPLGQLVPIRLAQIGSISMRVENGECRREFHVVERVVSMEVDLFPWTEIESFAAALQANGFRLLTRLLIPLPDDNSNYDFEKMRKFAQDRSNLEMRMLEEAAIAYSDDEPTLVDGPLQRCRGGFDRVCSPVVGVIKTPRKYHLSLHHKQLLYQLEVGQRTPAFCLPQERLPVVTWFLRLSGSSRTTPSWGIVRIEISQSWFEKYHRQDWEFVDKLSRTIYEYRCKEQSYDRSAVSLHPIVRGEESLGSLFDPTSILTNRFYRLTQL